MELRTSNSVTPEEEDSFEKAIKAPILKNYKLPTTQGLLISLAWLSARDPQGGTPGAEPLVWDS